MKIKPKYLIISSILLVIIIGAIVWAIGASDDVNMQDPFEDQLSKCREISPSYIGLSEEDAAKKADSEKRSYRVVERDGESFPVTDDYSPSRVNFVIENSKVTKVNCG